MPAPLISHSTTTDIPLSGNGTPESVAEKSQDWNALWLEGRRQSTWGRRHTYTPALWDAHWTREPRRYFDQTERVAWVLERLPLEVPSRILDVCCGAGPLALPLARKGHDVTGIDVSPVGIERLFEVARTEGLENLKAVRGDWCTLNPAAVGAPFDVALVSYGLGTVEPRPFLEKMLAAARVVVVVEPAGVRHWQHPEFWPLVDGQPFDPGPDHRMIEALLRRMGHSPAVEVGSYSTSIAFETLDDAVGWLLVNAGLDFTSAPAEDAARRYLEPRLYREGGRLVLRQGQSIAMLVVAS